MEGDLSWKATTAVAVGIFILLICVFSVWKAALSQREDTLPQDGSGVTVVATFYPLYVALLNITAGTDAQPSLLTPADTGCLHDYQITTADMKKLEAADVIVASGAGMESFLDKVIASKGDAVVAASEGFPLTGGNVHIWMSTAGALWQAQQIAAKLAAADARNADTYKRNCDRYTARLDELSAKIRDELSPFRARKVVLLSEAFSYLADEAALDVVLVLDGEENSLSAKQMAAALDLIRTIQQNGEPLVLFSDGASSAAVRLIEQESGLHIVELDSCVRGELSSGAYISAMERNIALMKSALEGE